ncbi:hypothetical protein N9948_01365 [bacterium]|nr:hypothetical protein [bacterium]
MAFDFLGTIESLEQFEEFEEFVRIEASKVQQKLDTLQNQKIRNFELLDKFKKADQILRQGYSLAERADIDYIKNPRTQTNYKPRIIDSFSSIAVDNLKSFIKDEVKCKRENTEYKIKRIRDLNFQIDDEISFLNEKLENYEDDLNTIRVRFDLDDFEEVQKVAPVDQKDIDPSIPVTPKDAGRETDNGTTLYLVLSVKAYNKTITFDTAAPSLKPNQQINLINGQNNGVKTVFSIKNERTIQVFEDLIDENPSQTKVDVL